MRTPASDRRLDLHRIEPMDARKAYDFPVLPDRAKISAMHFRGPRERKADAA
jgi:hypothetical protein